MKKKPLRTNYLIISMFAIYFLLSVFCCSFFRVKWNANFAFLCKRECNLILLLKFSVIISRKTSRNTEHKHRLLVYVCMWLSSFFSFFCHFYFNLLAIFCCSTFYLIFVHSVEWHTLVIFSSLPPSLCVHTLNRKRPIQFRILRKFQSFFAFVSLLFYFAMLYTRTAETTQTGKTCKRKIQHE